MIFAVVEFQPPVYFIDALHGIAHFGAAAFKGAAEIGGIVDFQNLIENETRIGARDLTIIAHAGHQESTGEDADGHDGSRHDDPPVEPEGEKEHEDELNCLCPFSRHQNPVQIENQIEQDDRQRRPRGTPRKAQDGDGKTIGHELREEEIDNRHSGHLHADGDISGKAAQEKIEHGAESRQPGCGPDQPPLTETHAEKPDRLFRHPPPDHKHCE